MITQILLTFASIDVLRVARTTQIKIVVTLLNKGGMLRKAGNLWSNNSQRSRVSHKHPW
ncbi:hypothetical protein AF72_10785 [Xylella taiwanensis]|uniref:Uncharacterized protein n=1 Tax=Xylella taiwanensis TaxID=1444770 RepID=Z9JGA2_9GAMM|nr:hypothetical protein AF72_10785 [Xylella taiwanensis]